MHHLDVERWASSASAHARKYSYGNWLQVVRILVYLNETQDLRITHDRDSVYAGTGKRHCGLC